MKHLQRFLIPIIVLAALVLSVAGIALAREMTSDDIFRMRDEEVEFTGTVEAMDGNTWTVDGRTLIVPTSAEIKDAIVVGQVVKVHASLAEGGTYTVREIELADALPANSNENGNDNLNENDNEDAIENDNEDANQNDNDDGSENDNDDGDQNDNSGGDHDDGEHSGNHNGGNDNSGGQGGDDHGGGPGDD